MLWQNQKKDVVCERTIWWMAMSDRFSKLTYADMDMPVETLLRTVLQELRELRDITGTNSWQCQAIMANTGANDPQDCDWPGCGCDPNADKVIAALQESGYLHPFCEARKDLFICNRRRGHKDEHMDLSESGGKVGWRNE